MTVSGDVTVTLTSITFSECNKFGRILLRGFATIITLFFLKLFSPEEDWVLDLLNWEEEEVLVQL